MTRKAKHNHMQLVPDIQEPGTDSFHYKSLTIHDLKAIKPLNEPQRQMFQSYFSGNVIVANGSAGTGKTFAALFLALNDVLSKKSPQDRVIIVRSAVPSREIGHLPGTFEEKLEPYEEPYKDMFAELLNRNTAYDKMKLQGVVKFMPTSFVRGLTWDNAVVVVDEVQNMTFNELNSVITRIGTNTKLIVIGDYIQTDLYRKLNDKSGMKDFLAVASKIDEMDIITFTQHDIVRSAFVKAWICALEDSGIMMT